MKRCLYTRCSELVVLEKVWLPGSGVIICCKRDSTWKFATAEVGRQYGKDVSCNIRQLFEELNARIKFLIVADSWQITETCKLSHWSITGQFLWKHCAICTIFLFWNQFMQKMPIWNQKWLFVEIILKDTWKKQIQDYSQQLCRYVSSFLSYFMQLYSRVQKQIEWALSTSRLEAPGAVLHRLKQDEADCWTVENLMVHHDRWHHSGKNHFIQ